MLTQTFVAGLRCPDSGQALQLASEDLLRDVNTRIESSSARSCGGAVLEEKIDSGLLREDGKVLYPVFDDLPILLLEDAIDLS
ncbi:MAG: hypothetical protein AAF517_17660 [Planctomycetota bacterium]